MEKKKIHVPSLVLMIVGLVFSFISPIVTYVCSIISLVMSIRKRRSNIMPDFSAIRAEFKCSALYFCVFSKS
ncbi:MAG: hypothetical protein NC340_07000 [Ruminococcus flavefaciens]|nr:hypothetical protein [Ruminococcus flavefaciens]MCM1230397.1 hypothetical protein [Ruminococcus flavefaciens]